MTTTPFLIEWPAAGRIAVMPRPAGGDRLELQLAALRRTGVDILVSALTPAEQQRLELTEEAQVAAAAGISFISFPIPDRDVPPLDELQRLAASLAAQVASGRFVVAHCWGGIGRSAVIAGAVLIQLGATAAEAAKRISTVRGMPVPETSEQRELLTGLAEALAAG